MRPDSYLSRRNCQRGRLCTWLCGRIPILRIAIGNNDALQALTFGAAPTNTATFALEYNLLFAALASTHAKLIVTNIPNVTEIPFLVPVPAFKAACPSPAPPLPAGTTAADFVVPNITNPTATAINVCTELRHQIGRLVASSRASRHSIQCHHRGGRAPAQRRPCGFQQRQIHTALETRLPIERTARNYCAAFLGGLFSLDGIHPTNTGYAILANAVINAMNQQFHSNVPLVSVDQRVAKTDPLVP